jgi:broad-specificity NMP kinase
MKTSILITAVTGSGKSTVCKALQQLGYNASDIEAIEGLFELVDEQTGEPIPGNLEQIRDGVDWSCNKSRLSELVESCTEELTFYCGGMSNTTDVWDLFDKVIILTVSDATTVKRLSTRRAGEFGSTQVNREWVLSWKQDFERRLRDLGGIPVSAEGTPTEVARLILNVSS